MALAMPSKRWRRALPLLRAALLPNSLAPAAATPASTTSPPFAAAGGVAAAGGGSLQAAHIATGHGCAAEASGPGPGSVLGRLLREGGVAVLPMPRLSHSMTEGRVTKWHVADGAEVRPCLPKGTLRSNGGTSPDCARCAAVCLQPEP
jgi:hypothetical protein